MGRVKAEASAVRGPSKSLTARLPALFALPRPLRPNLVPTTQELTMADLAFVAATVAVFALVALVARGVTKL
ncbi:hypothetical protein C6N75_07080 [Streptomyces solincola]|uniref:Uncharacterized protein n=1 Tax=Streptomyces solincola TaxID=2100817 RepID=A0A2S9PZQ3_9ACTN|nr:hypothetical protein C6N75_07080 [Streptomyces solincola]